MYFCYRHGLDFHAPGKGYRIGYATSDDLVSWVREEGDPIVSGSENDFDSDMVSYPHHFLIGSRRYLAYLGNGFGKAGFGLAELEQHS